MRRESKISVGSIVFYFSEVMWKPTIGYITIPHTSRSYLKLPGYVCSSMANSEKVESFSDFDPKPFLTESHDGGHEWRGEIFYYQTFRFVRGFSSIDGIFRSESGALIYHEAKEIKGRCPDARFAVENGVFGE